MLGITIIHVSKRGPRPLCLEDPELYLAITMYQTLSVVENGRDEMHIFMKLHQRIGQELHLAASITWDGLVIV